MIVVTDQPRDRHAVLLSCLWTAKNHHVNRAPDVETCCEEKINANLLSKSQLLPAEVRETEQTTLNVPIPGRSSAVSDVAKELGSALQPNPPDLEKMHFQQTFHFAWILPVKR